MSPEVNPSTDGTRIIVDADPDRTAGSELGQFDVENQSSDAVATARLIERPYVADFGRVASVVVEGPTRTDANTYFAA